MTQPTAPSNDPISNAPVEKPSLLSELAPLGVCVAIAIGLQIANPSLARTLFIFIVTLGVLVFVHEWGHFQFARWAGMKVNRFALGFPPFVFTRRVNDIDYSIGALPIGGLVDIAGLGSEEEMVAQSREKVDEMLERTNIGEKSDHKAARAQAFRDPSRPRGQKQFQDGNLFWRFMVLFAGPLMNFALALVLFIGVFSIKGDPQPDSIRAVVSSPIENMPASRTGLKAGDEIVKVAGKETLELEDVVTAIHRAGTAPTTITILRGKETLTLPITPELRDLKGDGKKLPSIGIEFDTNSVRAIRHFTYEKMSVPDAIKNGFLMSAGVSLQILDTVKRALTRNLHPQEVKGIGGPVKIAQQMGQAADFGPTVLFKLAAILSVNLGLMNLLPFPALDGGRILFLGFELLFRRPVPARIETVVHAAGMVMLLCFMLFITLRDVNAGALLKHILPS